VSEVEVRPSAIQGLGLFATRSFVAGERIRRVNVVREITPSAPLQEDAGERADHLDYPDGRVVLLGFPDRHINHSCDPSAWVQHDLEEEYLVARRAIAPGQEITCDYAMNLTGGSAWPCNCGVADCRGVVVGDFFQLPYERQREYRPYLAEWFVRRHRDRIARLEAAGSNGHEAGAA
jgi:hypothetical protein